MRLTKSFTLIEILIALSIMIALTAISVVLINPRKNINQAKDAGLRSKMVQIVAALETYQLNEKAYPDPANASELATFRQYITGSIVTTSGNETVGVDSYDFLQISADSVETGETGNDLIFYQINTSSTPTAEACLLAKSNEYPDEYFFWVPGGEVQLTSSSVASCSPELEIIAAN